MKKLSDSVATDAINFGKISEITPEYFVAEALENPDWMLYKVVNSFANTISINKIHDKIYEFVEDGSIIPPRPGRKIDYSGSLKNYFSQAVKECNLMSHSLITSDHLLLAILHDESKKNIIREAFSDEGITYEIAFHLSTKLHDVTTSLANETENDAEDTQTETSVPLLGKSREIRIMAPQGMITDEISSMLDSLLGTTPKKEGKKTTKTSGGITYCTNLNKCAANGEIDTLVGREEEIEKIYKIFNRKKSNNVLLIGNSGVGKTAIVEGLAKRIVENNVPHFLYGKIIYRLNIGELMASTQFRGMFEEKMNTLIKNLRNSKNSILFIDDIHIAINDKKSDFDLGGMLMEILSSGEVQIIATTTYRGYKMCFEGNTNLARRFQKITVDAPNEEYSFEILMGLKPAYEKFHGVVYTKEALRECVRLSKEYVTDRTLPTSAIDIMDEAGATSKYGVHETPEIKVLKNELSHMNADKDSLIRADEVDSAEELAKEIDNKRLGLAKLEDAEAAKATKATVGVNEIYKTISEHTNIPISRISTSEKKIISNIDNVLKEHIVGQDEAIEKITRAIKRSKVGFHPSNRPLGSFLCIGNTGCGKTLMAKMIAKEVFGDEKFLVRFDMSEYADKTSVNKLIGSAAGYVGFEQGGLLTEKIKNQKHAVLLVDEIEKAHDEVYNLFLQILDEGCLTDNTGQKVDFRNTIIILTSNIGAKEAALSKGIGFNVDDNTNKRNIIEKSLKNKFPPEFINRLDDIVYFNTLTEDNLKEITRIELEKLNSRIKITGNSIIYDANLIEYLYNLIKEQKEYGARPIGRIIQNEVENKITDLLLENDYDNHEFTITINDGIMNIK